jgi:hemerythrin superfamily protein
MQKRRCAASGQRPSVQAGTYVASVHHAIVTRTAMKAVPKRSSPPATGMIRLDHANVITAFHRYRPDASAAAKQALVASICAALEIHAQLEEEIFYPAMREIDPECVEKNVPEHDRMRVLMGALRNMKPTQGMYERTFMELMREVLHHIADEETMLLPRAEVLLRHRLHELGAAMASRKLQLMLPRAAEVARASVRARPAGTMLLGAGIVVAASFLFKLARQAVSAPTRHPPEVSQ